MNTVNVVVIKDGVVDELFAFEDDKEGNQEAEDKFVEKMRDIFTNFDDYSQEDIDTCLENGVAIYGHGSICLTHNS